MKKFIAGLLLLLFAISFSSCQNDKHHGFYLSHLPDIGKYEDKSSPKYYGDKLEYEFVPRDDYGEIMPVPLGVKEYSAEDGVDFFGFGPHTEAAYSFITEDKKIICAPFFTSFEKCSTYSGDSYVWLVSKQLKSSDMAGGDLPNKYMIISQNGDKVIGLGEITGYVTYRNNRSCGYFCYGKDSKTVIMDISGEIITEIDSLYVTPTVIKDGDVYYIYYDTSVIENDHTRYDLQIEKVEGGKISHIGVIYSSYAVNQIYKHCFSSYCESADGNAIYDFSGNTKSGKFYESVLDIKNSDDILCICMDGTIEICDSFGNFKSKVKMPDGLDTDMIREYAHIGAFDGPEYLVAVCHNGEALAVYDVTKNEFVSFDIPKDSHFANGWGWFDGGYGRCIAFDMPDNKTAYYGLDLEYLYSLGTGVDEINYLSDELVIYRREKELFCQRPGEESRVISNQDDINITYAGDVFGNCVNVTVEADDGVWRSYLMDLDTQKMLGGEMKCFLEIELPSGEYLLTYADDVCRVTDADGKTVFEYKDYAKFA